MYVRPSCQGLLAPAMLALLGLCLASPPSAAQTGYWLWANPAGGSSTTATNWFNGSINGTPGPTEEGQFFSNNTFNVNWASPVDSLYTLDITAGRLRFNHASRLGVRSYALINPESLTVLTGSLSADYWYVGYNKAASLYAVGPYVRLFSKDSTHADYFGWVGQGNVRMAGGAKFQSNGWIQIASYAADVCTTTVIGFNFLEQEYSGLRTLSRAGGGNRGSLMLGQSGHGTLQVINGGFVNLAGDLLMGNTGGYGEAHIFNTPTGLGSPSITVAGQTLLGTNLEDGGFGHILMEKGSTNLQGLCTARHGVMDVSNGAHLSIAGLLLGTGGNGSNQVGLLSAHDAGTSVTVSSQLQVGNGGSFGIGTVDALGLYTGSSLGYSGSSYLKVEGNGILRLETSATLSSNAEIDVRGVLTVDGTLTAPLVKLLNLGGDFASTYTHTGAIRARFNMSAGSQLFFQNPYSTVFSVGDSTAKDGFVSSGLTDITGDALRILDKNGAELGNVNLHQGTLQIPQGGTIGSGYEMSCYDGRVEGDLVNSGELYIPFGNTMDVAGRLSQQTGFMDGGGTLHILKGSTYSARGTGPYILVMNGSLAFKGSPATLSVGGGGFQSTGSATLNFNLGSPVSGGFDSLGVTGPVVVGGVLALRTGPGVMPHLGQEFKIITGSSVGGSFSDVTVNGVPAAGQVDVIYGPTYVRIVISGAITGVPSGGESTPVRTSLTSTGSLRRPAFELGLAKPSRVRLAAYDVAGRELLRLLDASLPAGTTRYPIPAGVVPSGVVFVRDEIDDGSGKRILRARGVAVR